MTQDNGLDVSPSWQELKDDRDRLIEALIDIRVSIEGDLCHTVRDVINGISDANEIYDDADKLDAIAQKALKGVKPCDT